MTVVCREQRRHLRLYSSGPMFAVLANSVFGELYDTQTMPQKKNPTLHYWKTIAHKHSHTYTEFTDTRSDHTHKATPSKAHIDVDHVRTDGAAGEANNRYFVGSLLTNHRVICVLPRHFDLVKEFWRLPRMNLKREQTEGEKVNERDRQKKTGKTLGWSMWRDTDFMEQRIQNGGDIWNRKLWKNSGIRAAKKTQGNGGFEWNRRAAEEP